MLKEVIETGKSVEAAIESACEKQGWSRDDIEWEIIDLPKKGFLGLRTTPAKVKVCKEVPDEMPAPKECVSNVKRERGADVVQKGAQDYGDKQSVAQAYVEEILKKMGLCAALSSEMVDGGLHIRIQGSGLGMIIGRRGETLDSIQYLTGLVVNRIEGDYLRITVDCGDYRIKRKATLEALAKKLSAQVLATNVSKVLEPMNPFERRIIHATVSEIDGVSSTSVGEEPNRKVIISTPTSRTRGSGGGARGGRPPRRDGGGYNRRDNRGGDRDRNRDRRPSSGNRSAPKPPPQPRGENRQMPEAKDDKPLYSKIDLD